MKTLKSILIIVVFIIATTISFCQNGQKTLSIKMPEFKQSSQIFPEERGRWETATADIDNDGDLDLIISHMKLETAIYLNDGKGFFIKSGQNFQSELHGLACGDLDNDEDIDLIFTSLNKNQPSPIYINNGRGAFELYKSPPPIETGIIVNLIDIDKDGDLDVFINRSSSLYLNNGKGNFSKSSLTLPVVTSFYDLNKDGAVDILSAVHGSGFKVYLNDKKGYFAEFSFQPKSDLFFCYTDFADIDNDGDIDVIFSNGNDKVKNSAGVLLNDGTGRLSDSGQKLSTVEYGNIGTGDLNNDGFTDVVISDNKNPAKVWLNDGKGIFIDSGVLLGEGIGWTNCLIKDLDNDGDMDVFITRIGGGNHGLWFNQLIESKNSTSK
jgi:hypothetical protein